MSDQVKMNLATVVTLCLAIAAGAWATSTEIHNYRLQNISSRLDIHESLILAHEKQIVEFRTVQLDVLETLGDVKADVKELLRSH